MNIEEIKDLLNNGVDINSYSDFFDGGTLLHVASGNGNIEIVTFFEVVGPPRIELGLFDFQSNVRTSYTKGPSIKI